MSRAAVRSRDRKRDHASGELDRIIQTPAARWLSATIFYAVLVLVALVALPYGTVHPWTNAFFVCVAFILTGLWAVEGWLAGKWLVSAHKLLIPCFALVLWTLIQSLALPGAGVELPDPNLIDRVWSSISYDPFESRSLALRFLAFTLILGLLLRYTSTSKRFRALLIFVVGLCIFCAAFGIVRQTMQRDVDGFVLPALRANLGYAQFVNRNHFAFLMEMGFGLTLGLLLGAIAGRDRRIVMLLAIIFPIWTTLVLSNSRGGILAMFCQSIIAVLLFSLVQKRRETKETTRESRTGGGERKAISSDSRSAAIESDDSKRGRAQPRNQSISLPLFRLALVGVLLLALLLGVVWIGGERFTERIASITTTSEPEIVAPEDAAFNDDEDGRGQIWQASWQLFKTHPVVGSGFGGYWVAITRYRHDSGKHPLHQAHNDYLELLVSGGIVGVALFIWFVAWVVKRAASQLKRTTDLFERSARVGALIGLFGIAVHSFFEFGLHTTVVALVALILVALLTVSIDENDATLESDDVSQTGSGLKNVKRTNVNRAVGGALAALALVGCGYGVWYSARGGIAAFYAEFGPYVSRVSVGATDEKRFEFVNNAIALAPFDPFTHYARSTAKLEAGQFAEAVWENERAVELRPGDYFLWMRLGRAYEKTGQMQRAQQALAQAVQLAPAYARPRWLYGNFLLREGRIAEGFAELSEAVQKDRKLLDYTLNLAWKAFDGNPPEIEKALLLRSTPARMQLAKFYVNKAKPEDAMRIYQTIEPKLTDAERNSMLMDLLAAKQFREAFAIWSNLKHNGAEANLGAATVLDGDFEKALQLTGGGFSWRQASPVAGAELSLDRIAPHAGKYSLLVNFKGDSNPALPVISQIIVVEPNARYRLLFHARTKKLVTGGLPVVTITDAGSGTQLAQSDSLTRDTEGAWRVFTVEFTAGGATRAVQINVQRAACVGAATCPAFGQLWLDEFTLQKR